MTLPNLDIAKFQEILGQAEPLVVHNVQQHMQGKWDPEYFVDRFSSKEVKITDCESNDDHDSTVAQFFKGFGAQRSASGVDLYDQVLKLKVMPPLVRCPS
jgi:hypothetical protein